MNEIIKKVLKNNIKLLDKSEKVIFYLRIQKYHRAMIDYMPITVELLTETFEPILLIQDYLNQHNLLVTKEGFNRMLLGIIEAQEDKDYVLLADLLELQLKPFLLSIQERIVTSEEWVYDDTIFRRNVKVINEQNTKLSKQIESGWSVSQLLSSGYEMEYSSSGLLTLARTLEGKRFYFHSNGEVQKEAAILAREWFKENCFEYVVYGLGLGYHIVELLELEENITVTVYESDINVIKLAIAFTELGIYVKQGRLNIIYDIDFTLLANLMNKMKLENSLYIHQPSLRNIRNKRIKEQLEDYFIQISSVSEQISALNGNFHKNIKRFDAFVDILEEKFHNKDLYLVAAGPSLDKNFELLKGVNDSGIVVAVGTVLKKLLNANIIPDYVIMTHGTSTVYEQVEGIESCNIPLLCLSTLYHKVMERYQGEKYIILQKDYRNAEQFATQNQVRLYETGGSVITTALDIGIQFGCKRIVFVGLDLAYTGEYAHAEGASAERKGDYDEEMRIVEGIHGEKLYTIKNLDIYRKWIEKRIESVKNITFINATEGGARIKGTINMELKKAILE